jgi:CheY-specific phosphatase CheX
MENSTLKEMDPMLKALERAVFKAMESIAFEEPNILPGPVEIDGEVISSFLRVVSPYLLLTIITMPRKLATNLTKTIYRDDEKEITDALLHDTVGEFLNTIIGTMMGDLTHGERIFEMGLPEKVKDKRELISANTQALFFQIEDYPFSIEIEGEAFFEE